MTIEDVNNASKPSLDLQWLLSVPFPMDHHLPLRGLFCILQMPLKQGSCPLILQFPNAFEGAVDIEGM